MSCLVFVPVPVHEISGNRMDYMQEESNSVDWDKLHHLNQELEPELAPRITVVIPTCNDARKIGITLENILAQKYPDFEILVIDAASSDRTIEIVKSFRSDKIRLSSVSSYNRYEMLNKGVFLARGLYLNFMFPGDYYLQKETFQIMMHLAYSKDWASLVYCGCLIREGEKEAVSLFRNFNLGQLKQGRQPTSLQSIWFHKQVFQEIGKFDTRYTLRGGFDLMCRFLKDERLTHAGTRRILTDYDLRTLTREMLICHFKETAKIIKSNFGAFALIKWFFSQKDLKRYLRYLSNSFKKALVGK